MFRISNFKYQIIIGLVVCTTGLFSWAQKKTLNPFARKISVLIQFDGEYKGQYQFDGDIRKEISGEPTPAANFPINNQCQMKAVFDLVKYKDQNMLKVFLTTICEIEKDQKKSSQTTKLFPEFVRLSDLKSESQRIQISKDFKNVQFKVIDLKL